MTTTVEIAATPLEVDAEGFLVDPEAWTEEIAEAIAREQGLPDLTERHRLVLRSMRRTFFATGASPSVRALAKESGVPVKELYELFPKGPAKLAARIAGVPKPRGCI